MRDVSRKAAFRGTMPVMVPTRRVRREDSPMVNVTRLRERVNNTLYDATLLFPEIEIPTKSKSSSRLILILIIVSWCKTN